VIKKPRKNEEAKARYKGCENTTTMGCNVRKTKQQRRQILVNNPPPPPPGTPYLINDTNAVSDIEQAGE